MATLGVVGVIDTRDDKVVKHIRVGKDPWRIYMSHDGKYAITPNNGDETISIIDLKRNKVAATLEAGPNMTGVNFAAGKAFVISSTSGFVYVYDMTQPEAGRPHQDRHEHPARDGDDRYARTRSSIWPSPPTTRSSSSTPRRSGIERVKNVGLYPWGTHIMDSKDNYCH